MSAEIELRLSDIEPPTQEPHHTIYTDIENLPDPTKLSFSYKAFNYDDITLYFQLVATGIGWTFPASTNEGSIASGANKTFTHDQYGSRARPSEETLEHITLTLKAYTDAGYTNLKWTYIRDVTIWFIYSGDGSWTTDELNNFDDGTVQGWSATAPTSPSWAVATDYVLSPPYSLKGSSWQNSAANWLILHKTVDTPNKAKVFMITNSRFGASTVTTLTLKITIAGTNIIIIIIPKTRWTRFVVPLPPNTVGVTIQLRLDGTSNSWPWTISHWIDDFKVISKN